MRLLRRESLVATHTFQILVIFSSTAFSVSRSPEMKTLQMFGSDFSRRNIPICKPAGPFHDYLGILDGGGTLDGLHINRRELKT